MIKGVQSLHIAWLITFRLNQSSAEARIQQKLFNHKKFFVVPHLLLSSSGFVSCRDCLSISREIRLHPSDQVSHCDSQIINQSFVIV